MQQNLPGYFDFYYSDCLYYLLRASQLSKRKHQNVLSNSWQCSKFLLLALHYVTLLLEGSIWNMHYSRGSPSPSGPTLSHQHSSVNALKKASHCWPFRYFSFSIIPTTLSLSWHVFRTASYYKNARIFNIDWYI